MVDLEEADNLSFQAMTTWYETIDNSPCCHPRRERCIDTNLNPFSSLQTDTLGYGYTKRRERNYDVLERRSTFRYVLFFLFSSRGSKQTKGETKARVEDTYASNRCITDIRHRRYMLTKRVGRKLRAGEKINMTKMLDQTIADILQTDKTADCLHSMNR